MFERVELSRLEDNDFFFNDDYSISLCEVALRRFGVTALRVSSLVSSTKRVGYYPVKVWRDHERLSYVAVKSPHYKGDLLSYSTSRWLIKRGYVADDGSTTTIYVKFINH